MSEPDLIKIKESLVNIALECGKVVREKSGKVDFEDKKNGVDLVTEIDRKVEEIISLRLQNEYPDYQFMGEESYVAGETKLTDEPTFIVDPIDGTTNFIHLFPFSCISLGFAYKKKAVVGVVYNPLTEQLYSAAKGHGAFLGEQRLPLRPSAPLSLQGALAAIEWGSDRTGNNFKVKTDTFVALAAESGSFVHGLRSLGSAALNISNVAAGTLDCYWEGGCYAWDVCAGWIILEEAGGRMVSGNAGEWDPALDSRVYFAVRGGENQTKFVEDFWSQIKGRLNYVH